jgi:hypothetical protein
MARKWEDVDAMGRLALFGLAFAAITVGTFVAEERALPPLTDRDLQFDLPENCEANRTSSGYTVTCDPVPAQGAWQPKDALAYW